MIDWNVITITAVLNIVLAVFWKFREITLSQIDSRTDEKIARLEIRLDGKFAEKAAVEEIKNGLSHLQDRVLHP